LEKFSSSQGWARPVFEKETKINTANASHATGRKDLIALNLWMDFWFIFTPHPSNYTNV
jgi:hypothetical protein